jgi:hypothetical protein
MSIKRLHPSAADFDLTASRNLNRAAAAGEPQDVSPRSSACNANAHTAE